MACTIWSFTARFLLYGLAGAALLYNTIVRQTLV